MAISATATKSNTTAKTASINVRVTKDVKAQAEELFASFGITPVSYTHLTLPTTPYV